MQIFRGGFKKSSFKKKFMKCANHHRKLNAIVCCEWMLQCTLWMVSDQKCVQAKGDTRSKMEVVCCEFFEYAEDSQWPDAGWLIVHVHKYFGPHLIYLFLFDFLFILYFYKYITNKTLQILHISKEYNVE